MVGGSHFKVGGLWSFQFMCTLGAPPEQCVFMTLHVSARPLHIERY